MPPDSHSTLHRLKGTPFTCAPRVLLKVPRASLPRIDNERKAVALSWSTPLGAGGIDTCVDARPLLGAITYEHGAGAQRKPKFVVHSAITGEAGCIRGFNVTRMWKDNAKLSCTKAMHY